MISTLMTNDEVLLISYFKHYRTGFTRALECLKCNFTLDQNEAPNCNYIPCSEIVSTLEHIHRKKMHTLH